MRPEDLHRVLRQQPFRPFRLHLPNGRTYEIRHPELAMVGRSTVLIGRPAPDLPQPTFDDYDVVALLYINNLEPLPPTPAPGNNPVP